MKWNQTYFILILFILSLIFTIQIYGTNIENFETNKPDDNLPKPSKPSRRRKKITTDSPNNKRIDNPIENTTITQNPGIIDISSTETSNPYEKNIALYPIPGTMLDNPFSSIYPVNTYNPIEENTVQFSKLTGLNNSTPVYFINDLGEGFCKYHKTNIEKWENECNKLPNDTCAATTCCVLLGGQKCVAGNKTGVKMTANYSDPWIKNRDYYYFMGKCYGNCKDKDYQFGAPLVPSSRCAPPGAKPEDHTYGTPYLENQRTQILPMKPNDNDYDDADVLFTSVDENNLILNESTNNNIDLLPHQMHGAAPNVVLATQMPRKY